MSRSRPVDNDDDAAVVGSVSASPPSLPPLPATVVPEDSAGDEKRDDENGTCLDSNSGGRSNGGSSNELPSASAGAAAKSITNTGGRLAGVQPSPAAPVQHKVRVGVRVRPLTDREMHGEVGKPVLIVRGSTGVEIGRRKFVFDNVFGPEMGQQDLYREVSPGLLRSFLDGYNATVRRKMRAGNAVLLRCCKTHFGSNQEPPFSLPSLLLSLRRFSRTARRGVVKRSPWGANRPSSELRRRRRWEEPSVVKGQQHLWLQVLRRRCRYLTAAAATTKSRRRGD